MSSAGARNNSLHRFRVCFSKVLCVISEPWPSFRDSCLQIFRSVNGDFAAVAPLLRGAYSEVKCRCRVSAGNLQQTFSLWCVQPMILYTWTSLGELCNCGRLCSECAGIVFVLCADVFVTCFVMMQFYVCRVFAAQRFSDVWQYLLRVDGDLGASPLRVFCVQAMKIKSCWI